MCSSGCTNKSTSNTEHDHLRAHAILATRYPAKIPAATMMKQAAALGVRRD
jgi:hypothetical protein